MRAIQSRHFLAYLLGLLAAVHLKAGNGAQAMSAVQDGLSVAEATGERFYNAALLRLRGELLAHTPEGRNEAKASFHAAITVAREQGALALERQARASLRRSCA
jgi:hypothetical protein